MLSARDQRDLRWLELGHYFSAGLLLLMTAGFRLYLNNVAVTVGGPGPPRFQEWFFSTIFTIVLVWHVVGILTAAGAAYLLRARRRPAALVALSAVHCLFVPLGILVGLFTMILVRRPTVRAEFT